MANDHGYAHLLHAFKCVIFHRKKQKQTKRLMFQNVNCIQIIIVAKKSSAWMMTTFHVCQYIMKQNKKKSWTGDRSSKHIIKSHSSGQHNSFTFSTPEHCCVISHSVKFPRHLEEMRISSRVWNENFFWTRRWDEIIGNRFCSFSINLNWLQLRLWHWKKVLCAIYRNWELMCCSLCQYSWFYCRCFQLVLMRLMENVFENWKLTNCPLMRK